MTHASNNIDLLPESIRLRCQQGLRTGRYIAAVALAIVLIIALATHSRIELERARDRYLKARETADLVLKTEAKAAQIRTELDMHQRRIELHDALAWPVRVTSLVSTVVNRMPPSVSLDRLELTGVTNRTPAPTTTRRGSAPVAQQPAARTVRGELSGFAQSDSDISTLIHALEHAEPLGEISLDFSRTRTIRGQSAREFRLSFRVDLDAFYEAPVSVAGGQPSEQDEKAAEPSINQSALTGVTDA